VRRAAQEDASMLACTPARPPRAPAAQVARYARAASIAACVAALSAACSGGDGGSGSAGASRERITIPLGDTVSGVSVVAGVPQLTSFTLALPPGDDLEGATVDVAATLALAEVTPTAPLALGDVARAALAVAQGNAGIAVSRALPFGTLCDASVGLRPFEIGFGALFRPVSAAPGTNVASAAGLETIRLGPFVYCVEILSPIDATVTLGGIVADVTRTPCATAPASFAGTWTGTYTCSYSCGGGFGGDIVLEVTQTGDQATYVDDGGATFTGRVCGNTFRFARNSLGETERGTLTLNANGTATKQSTFWGTFDRCTGDCTDVLHR
jgi:hypothetical protein